jgi:hypothetical protein
MIGQKCFAECHELSIVRFEPNSRLAGIGKYSFALCPLETVWIPSCIQTIAIDHFGYCPDVRIFIIETGLTVTPHPRPLPRAYMDWVFE